MVLVGIFLHRKYVMDTPFPHLLSVAYALVLFLFGALAQSAWACWRTKDDQPEKTARRDGRMMEKKKDEGKQLVRHADRSGSPGPRLIRRRSSLESTTSSTLHDVTWYKDVIDQMPSISLVHSRHTASAVKAARRGSINNGRLRGEKISSELCAPQKDEADCGLCAGERLGEGEGGVDERANEGGGESVCALVGADTLPPPMAANAASAYHAYRAAMGTLLPNPNQSSARKKHSLMMRQPSYSELFGMQRRLEVTQCPPEASANLITDYLKKVRKYEDDAQHEVRWTTYTTAHFPNKLKLHTHHDIMRVLGE